MTMNKMIIKLDNANQDIRRHEDEIRNVCRRTENWNNKKYIFDYHAFQNFMLFFFKSIKIYDNYLHHKFLF